MAAGKANLRQRVGYFDPNNGLFLQRNGTELSFIIRTYTGGSADDTRKVVQSAWNGDKLDGSGASGITLDTTKAQILFADFEWLGVGSVRVGFVIDGQYIDPLKLVILLSTVGADGNLVEAELLAANIDLEMAADAVFKAGGIIENILPNGFSFWDPDGMRVEIHVANQF
jgi:hypothetical protein